MSRLPNSYWKACLVRRLYAGPLKRRALIIISGIHTTSFHSVITASASFTPHASLSSSHISCLLCHPTSPMANPQGLTPMPTPFHHAAHPCAPRRLHASCLHSSRPCSPRSLSSQGCCACRKSGMLGACSPCIEKSNSRSSILLFPCLIFSIFLELVVRMIAAFCRPSFSGSGIGVPDVMPKIWYTPGFSAMYIMIIFRRHIFGPLFILYAALILPIRVVAPVAVLTSIDGAHAYCSKFFMTELTPSFPSVAFSRASYPSCIPLGELEMAPRLTRAIVPNITSSYAGVRHTKPIVLVYIYICCFFLIFFLR